MERIEITKELIPYQFNILLGSDVFDMEVNYNAEGDFFTITLYKNEELICANEPIVYGVPLFKDVYEAGKFPPIDIVPLDESGEKTEANWDNLNEVVFLCIDDEVGDDE